ncbi:translation initiation factor IF-2 N-terminal domain-containing protein, partial [Tessaracoccus lubricantis]
MAKPRVHEIAKEIGKTSKELLTWLGENGEYVRGPSSTLEAPVVRRVREAFSAKGGDAAPAKQSKPAPKAEAPAPVVESHPDVPVATPGAPDPSAPAVTDAP